MPTVLTPGGDHGVVPRSTPNLTEEQAKLIEELRAGPRLTVAAMQQATASSGEPTAWESAAAMAERYLCQSSFRQFLRSVRIPDRHRGTIRWEEWPHLVRLAEMWESGEDVITLKARQLGVSWLLAAYALWVTMYQDNSEVLEISITQSDADELLDKSYQLWLLLPDHLRIRILRKHQRLMAFEDGGIIRSLPSTPNAGRGRTPSVVIVDEAAFHQWASRNYEAYKPSLDGGGQLLMVSTSGGPSGLFYDLWTSASDRKNQYKAVFVPWWARPNRQVTLSNGDAAPNMEWLDAEYATFPGLPSAFRREFPATPNEAWLSSRGLVYGFDDQEGILIFDPALHPRGNVSTNPVPWEQCVGRYAGLDWGGGDPTAMGAYGMTPNGRLHKYGEFHRVGPTSIDEMNLWLLGWTPESQRDDLAAWWDFMEAGADEPQAIATLAGYGYPIRQAITRKNEGLGAVALRLRRRMLTFNAETCPETLNEFARYRWSTRRDISTGEEFSLGVPYDRDDHHMDEMRYVVIRIDRRQRAEVDDAGGHFYELVR